MGYKHFLEFKLKYIEEKFLIFPVMSDEKKVTVNRDGKGVIIPIAKEEEEVNKREIIIRNGQLN